MVFILTLYANQRSDVHFQRLFYIFPSFHLTTVAHLNNPCSPEIYKNKAISTGMEFVVHDKNKIDLMFMQKVVHWNIIIMLSTILG